MKGMKERYATLMGLVTQDTPFVIGASDGVLSNLGVNSVGKGEVAVTIGKHRDLLREINDVLINKR